MRWRLEPVSELANPGTREVEHLPPAERSDRALAERFRRFASEECSEDADAGAGSRTYELLSKAVADSPQMLGLARRCRIGQPVPNLWFAAVKRMLMDHPGCELARRYNTVRAGGDPGDDLAQVFAEFALAHRGRIAEFLETRMVQTNEAGRCAYLAPSFLAVARENAGRQLAIVDVGASAGLNLLWDKYGYRYSDGTEFGAASPSVLIECEARNGMPELPEAFPEVSFRVGIDLEPVDLGDEEEYRWMQSLIWPEHGDRAELLSAAREVWLGSRPTVMAGDALDLLPQVMAEAPGDAVLCVFHCHLLNQLSPAGRKRFGEILRQHSEGRRVYQIASEGEQVEVLRWTESGSETILSARRQVHGKWLQWDTLARVSGEGNR